MLAKRLKLVRSRLSWVWQSSWQWQNMVHLARRSSHRLVAYVAGTILAKSIRICKILRNERLLMTLVCARCDPSTLALSFRPLLHNILSVLSPKSCRTLVLNLEKLCCCFDQGVWVIDHKLKKILKTLGLHTIVWSPFRRVNAELIHFILFDFQIYIVTYNKIRQDTIIVLAI